MPDKSFSDRIIERICKYILWGDAAQKHAVAGGGPSLPLPQASTHAP